MRPQAPAATVDRRGLAELVTVFGQRRRQCLRPSKYSYLRRHWDISCFAHCRHPRHREGSTRSARRKFPDARSVPKSNSSCKQSVALEVVLPLLSEMLGSIERHRASICQWNGAASSSSNASSAQQDTMDLKRRAPLKFNQSDVWVGCDRDFMHANSPNLHLIAPTPGQQKDPRVTKTDLAFQDMGRTT